MARPEPHLTNTLDQDAAALVYARWRAGKGKLLRDEGQSEAIRSCLVIYERMYGATRRRQLVAALWRAFLPWPYALLPLGWIPDNAFGAWWMPANSFGARKATERGNPIFVLSNRVTAVLDAHNVTSIRDEAPALRTLFLRALRLDSPHKRRGGRPRKPS